MTVADEVYRLYPESRRNLRRVQDRPDHRFFKSYGESMPRGDWNHPGTKQGIYMIGPDAEYLEGKFAAGTDPRDIAARLQRALERWEKLRRDKGYANKPVPAVVSTLPPQVEDKEFVLRVNTRDLPRDGGEQCRFDKDKHLNRPRLEYLKWAWNENWQAVEGWRALVPGDSPEPQPVDDRLVRALAREMLVDNVRGQVRVWKPEHVRVARLTKRTVATSAGATVIRYEGRASMVDGDRALEVQLFGEGRYDVKQRDLVRFELLGLGTRRGADSFNKRGKDPGPSPIGFAIARYRQPATK